MDFYGHRDGQQITFVKLNGFCQLRKNSLTPLFLMDNIKMDSIPTKINRKKRPLLHCISGFESTSYKHL